MKIDDSPDDFFVHGAEQIDFFEHELDTYYLRHETPADILYYVCVFLCVFRSSFPCVFDLFLEAG